MDLNFQYTNNNSPNFAGIFQRVYERVDQTRQEKKAAKASATSTDAPAPEPKPEAAPEWNPYSRARAANNSHAAQVKSAAEAVQTYTGKATRATESRPAPRVATPASSPRQFDPAARRRALPYQQESMPTRQQASAMGRHAKPQNPAEGLGKHAAGPPPAYETRPMRPGMTGRHAL